MRIRSQITVFQFPRLNFAKPFSLTLSTSQDLLNHPNIITCTSYCQLFVPFLRLESPSLLSASTLFHTTIPGLETVQHTGAVEVSFTSPCKGTLPDSHSIHSIPFESFISKAHCLSHHVSHLKNCRALFMLSVVPIISCQ